MYVCVRDRGERERERACMCVRETEERESRRECSPIHRTSIKAGISRYIYIERERKK